MATGSFSNALTPNSASVAVGTTAVRLSSSSALSARFTLIASNANTVRVYVGDSAVTATRGIPLTAGNTKDFGMDKMFGDQTSDYDLASFWAVATAAAQVLTVLTYKKR